MYMDGENTKVYSQLSVANPNRGSVSLQIDLDDPRAAGRRPGARGTHLQPGVRAGGPRGPRPES